MIKHSYFYAVAAAALSLAGSSAQAAFTYSTTSTFSVISGTNTGTAIALLDQTNFSATGTNGSPNVQVTLTGSVTDNFTFQTRTTITVAGATGSLVEVATFQVTNGVFFSTGTPTLTGSIAGFTFSNPSATGASVNSTTNNGAVAVVLTQGTAVVPEPASVAMVGLGLAGVGGLALRRRRVA